MFQSTPPRRRRRAGDCTGRRRRPGFNPRLRAGGDGPEHDDKHQDGVSIHASAQEATISMALTVTVSAFQSTPPRRRRRWGRARPPGALCFNPRLRAGGDKRVHERIDGLRVSIHASAQEATAPEFAVWPSKPFQSTPPRRRRHRPIAAQPDRAWFQSTPPRRRRQTAGRSARQTARFNPRLRAGGDGFVATMPPAKTKVSIHASAQEATPMDHLTGRERRVSIHASAQEATRSPWATLPEMRFNPRLRAGGDSEVF